MELLPFPVHVIIKSPWFGWRDTDRGGGRGEGGGGGKGVLNPPPQI